MRADNLSECFVVRLSGSTLLNKALAGEAKAKDLFFKAKASYFQGQGQGQGLTSLQKSAATWRVDTQRLAGAYAAASVMLLLYSGLHSEL